jgi:dTDP-4-dehydrorhamnose reductase
VTRVLVTGASGLLGSRLVALLAHEFEVVAARRHTSPPPGVRPVGLDLADPGGADRALEAARPQAVVHAAAVADADTCEREPERAQAVNVGGTAVLAEACARYGIRLVVVSTDQVFDGNRGRLSELDPARPLMLYGRTKLAAEEEALRRCAGSAVVRVALLCGLGGGPRGTASEALAWALERRERPRLYTDQFRTPVDAEAVATALRSLLRGTGEGRYHLGGPERVSRHELGLRVASVLGLDPAGIEAVTQATFSVGAPRPADVSLDSSRARRELGFAPRPLDAMIRSGRLSPPPV